MKALAPQPENRYANATEFRRALERVFESPNKRRTVSRWVGYACIGAASLFAFGVFAQTHRTRPAPPNFARADLLPTAATDSLPMTALVAATGTATATATATPTLTRIAPLTRTASAPAASSSPPNTRLSRPLLRTDKKLTPPDPATGLTAGASALENGSLTEALSIHRALAKQH